MIRKSKIAIVPLGHEVYFQQFPTLYDELVLKAHDVVGFMDESKLAELCGVTATALPTAGLIT